MEALLASETDIAGFRAEARSLLAHQVPPESVHWQAPALNADFFIDTAGQAERYGAVPKAASAIVPASFLRLTEMVVLHHDPERFALLYRLLWRLVHEPGLRHNALDADMLLAHQMGQSVRRDIHKMKTMVKFRSVQDGGPAAVQLAWHDPSHHIVEFVSPWFARRMAGERWAILTPERCVECDGEKFHFAQGFPRAEAPRFSVSNDTWLDCYRRAFGDKALALQATA